MKWAINEGGPGDEEDAYVAVDKQNNIFVCGSHADSAIFGNETVQPDTLYTIGDIDIFVVKYDSSGHYLWARSGGGEWDDHVKAVTTDLAGNVIITGRVSKSAVFGKGQNNETVLPGFGEWDILIAKYDGQGNLDWAKDIGNESVDQGSAVVTDNDNNVIVSGYFTRSAVFGGEEDSLYSPYLWAERLFVVKYDPGGNCLWARQSYGDEMSSCQGLGVDVYQNNEVLVQAFVFFYARFDQDGPNDTLISAIPDTGGMVMAEFSTDGAFKSVENAGDWDYITENFTIDQTDHIIQTGRFSSDIHFGSGEHSVELINRGGYDVFVAKFGDVYTGIRRDGFAPQQFQLKQNYPNPFNGSTTFIFSLNRPDQVALNIYDICGKKIITLVDRPFLPGTYKFSWNGLNSDGTEAASGVYFGELTTSYGSRVVKMLLVR